MVDEVAWSIARRKIRRFGSPAFIGLHVTPPLVLLKIPAPNVPAYTLADAAGSTARVRTLTAAPDASVIPERTGDQVAPLSVLFAISPVNVPAYKIVLGTAESAMTEETLPLNTCVHDCAPSIVLYTPPPMPKEPAYKVA